MQRIDTHPFNKIYNPVYFCMRVAASGDISVTLSTDVKLSQETSCDWSGGCEE
jgi:hypothetical protein